MVEGDPGARYITNLWRDARQFVTAAGRIGRPSDHSQRQAAILEALRLADRTNGPPKERDVAAQLGRLVPGDSSLTTRDFQDDVKALGGWAKIRHWRG